MTQFDDFDVLWPSSDRRRIPIEVSGDRPHTLAQFRNVTAQIESFDTAPQGERAVFGARVEQVKTVTSEVNLRYLDWVSNNRRKVHELSNGRIGYIHVPNTAVEGNRELFKGMLAEARRDALIIDDRYNGGGFIPDRMIELLGRTPLN